MLNFAATNYLPIPGGIKKKTCIFFYVYLHSNCCFLWPVMCEETLNCFWRERRIAT